jgi:hypothetical protein
MNGSNTQINTQEAKLALLLIEKQKMKASNMARMPIWLNVIFSVLVTWLIYFELINRELKLSDLILPILLLGVFSILGLWSKHLKEKGLKVKWFPNKKITYFAFIIGVCLGMFGDEIGMYIYEELSPWGSYIVPLTTTILLVYFGHRFPLSEVVTADVLNEKR